MWAWTRKGKKVPVDARPLTVPEIEEIGSLGIVLSTGSGIDESWTATEYADEMFGDAFLGALFGDWSASLLWGGWTEVHQSHWGTCPNAKQHSKSKTERAAR